VTERANADTRKWL